MFIQSISYILTWPKATNICYKGHEGEKQLKLSKTRVALEHRIALIGVNSWRRAILGHASDDGDEGMSHE